MAQETALSERGKDWVAFSAKVESGNHKWPISWADLNKVQINKQIAASSTTPVTDTVFNANFKFKFDKVFKEKYELISIKKINKNTSLILLKKNALKLDLTVPLRVLQKLIRKKDDKPIDSQPKNNVKRLLPKTRTIILNINQFIRRANVSSCA